MPRYRIIISLFLSLLTVAPSRSFASRATSDQLEQIAFADGLDNVLRPYEEQASTSLKVRRGFRAYGIPALRYGGIAGVLFSILIHSFKSDDYNDLEHRYEHINQCLKLFGSKWTPEQMNEAKAAGQSFEKRMRLKKSTCRLWKKIGFISFMIAVAAWAGGYCGDHLGWWLPDSHSYVERMLHFIQTRERFERNGASIRPRLIPIAGAEVVPTGNTGNCLFESVVPQLAAQGVVDAEGNTYTPTTLRQAGVAEIVRQCNAELESAAPILPGLQGEDLARYTSENMPTCSIVYHEQLGNYPAWLQEVAPNLTWNDIPRLYQTVLGQPGFWGGAPEMDGMARVLNATLYVFNREDRTGIRGQIAKGGNYRLAAAYGDGPLRVVLLRDGEHFEGWQLPVPTA